MGLPKVPIEIYEEQRDYPEVPGESHRPSTGKTLTIDVQSLLEYTTDDLNNKTTWKSHKTTSDFHFTEDGDLKIISGPFEDYPIIGIKCVDKKGETLGKPLYFRTGTNFSKLNVVKQLQANKQFNKLAKQIVDFRNNLLAK